MPREPSGATLLSTAHYTLVSTATPEQTRVTARAVEAVFAAYARMFPTTRGTTRYSMVLYRDRTQFTAYSGAPSWAEAYYRYPNCHAYAAQVPNGEHWMRHEAVHQLLREASGFRPPRWANEGLASYFGASDFDASGLRLDRFRGDAYPVRWFDRWPLSGSLSRDIVAGEVISLRVLVREDDDIADNVNLHYLEYWSLTRFLMQGRNGRYAKGFLQFVRRGRSLADFEHYIRPVDEIEAAWYHDIVALQQQRRRIGTGATTIDTGR